MKHMKHLLMFAGAIAVAAAAYMAYQHYYSPQDNVKVQGGGFCLGLCGKDKEGKGWGIGIGGSDKGPMIGTGPYGDNDSKNSKRNKKHKSQKIKRKMDREEMHNEDVSMNQEEMDNEDMNMDSEELYN